MHFFFLLAMRYSWLCLYMELNGVWSEKFWKDDGSVVERRPQYLTQARNFASFSLYLFSFNELKVFVSYET